MKSALLLFFMVLPIVVHATTWHSDVVDDPIFDGHTCSVSMPASWGSYIYNWDSKYDQVFWPYTVSPGIWSCEDSGFVAFIEDFSDIDPPEAEIIRDYLLENPPKGDSITDKLDRLETLYSLRVTDESFNNWLLRLLARWHQSLDNFDKANNYRKSALASIETSLKEDIEEVQKLEYLYLAANYTRQFGDKEASDKYLAKLDAAIDNLEGEEASGFAEYLEHLSKETPYIEPGGLLDPDIPPDLHDY